VVLHLVYAGIDISSEAATALNCQLMVAAIKMVVVHRLVACCRELQPQPQAVSGRS